MDALMNEVITVGGMTGTRAEYVEWLVDNAGWTLNQAMQIAVRVRT